MGITDSKKDYKAPQAQVVEEITRGLLCQSMKGGFGVSNDGNVKEDDDNVWGENPGW